MLETHAPTARSPIAPPLAPSIDLTARLWRDSLTREHGFEPLVVEGALPPELTGTLFRNGPGLFEIGGRRYAHPFEADGAVTAIRFAGGRALGASRVTPTAALAEERAANRHLYGFTASWPRRMRNALTGRAKNSANTSVMIWQDRLFAMVESNLPTELAPGDLAMRGETDLGGVVRTAFSAHPHHVPARQATYNFGVIQGRHTELAIYELPDVGAARELAAVPLGGPTMLHDFIATANHLVFFVSPVRVDVPRALLQLGDFAKLFRWKPELGTEVIVVPIDRPREVVRFTTEAFYQWHFVNAYDDGGRIVVDYVRYPSFDTFYEIGAILDGGRGDALRAGRYHRATIDLGKRTLRSEQQLDRTCEFATLAPGAAGAPHGATYLVLGDLAAIGKFDARTGALVAHELPSTQRTTEPLFVPRPGATADDDGHVIALQHDAPSGRAFVAIYDAARLPDGPVARAWFDHHVPITFHGTFSHRV